MWRLTRISSFRTERLAIRSNYLGVSGISRINLKPRKIRCHLSTLPEIPIIDYAVDNKLVRSKEISIEDQYTRKTPLEHVLLRPGMYVGPNERLPPSSCWVIDPPILPPTMEFMKAALQDPLNIQKQVEEATKFHIVKKELGLVPAMLKVFDEILVNASDNRFRHPDSCTRIDVIIDPGSEKHDPLILVFNDGKGIPIHMHKDEGIYVPEMLFGHLLTGSNFDDNEERLTGGRHGYGAKLANIFSKSFTVETLDSQNRLKYKQIWNTNMTESTLPKITKTSAKLKDYTCVSFVPDIVRLTGINDATKISDDDFAIMCRRVVDVAGCAAGKLKVTLNGQNVSQSSFSEYSQMYRKPETSPLCFHSINPRWNVGVGLSESGSFDSVSFVNGMSTNRGGSHVNVIVQQLTKYIQEHVEKINPELAEMINPSLIRRQLFVWCDAQIVNPTFDSQMKEYLTSSPTSFGSSYTLSNKYIRDILKDEEKGGPGIIEEILRIAKGRQQASLLKDFSGKKSKRHILSIPKLEDAHDAGSNLGSDCTLILTEGDSAKALAVAGLEVIGRKKFGVFPLRGKLLNVRDASISQLSKNAEVKALCSIIGLDFDKEYATTDERKELRYGHVMLMTDQDTGTYVLRILKICNFIFLIMFLL